MLEIKDLSIGYKNKRVQEHISASAKTGELVVVIGRNGSGKSTFLRTISGLIPPLGGTVLWNNADIHAMSATTRARNIAIVQTAAPTWSGLTVSEVIALGAFPANISSEDVQVMALLRNFNLEDLARERLDAVSDGERQKAMIARALMQNAPLIIMDEPTAFLDYPARLEWWKQVEALKASGHTIIVATHDILMLENVQVDQSWVFKRQQGLSALKGYVKDLSF